MRELVAELCSDTCAGREPGTPGGVAARAIVKRALAATGLSVEEQAVPGCRGANLIAPAPGDAARWVLVGAHYDHLGRHGRAVYRGADDNAAAVAILVALAAELALGPRRRTGGRRPCKWPPRGRGVLLCAFDGEEPPHFLSDAMGSEHFAAHPSVPLDTIDLMVCLDLVGHALGPRRRTGGPKAL